MGGKHKKGRDPMMHRTLLGIGQLDKGLDEAQAKGWTIIRMKDDWKQILAFENK